MRRFIKLATVCTLLVLGCAACSILYPTYYVRYRLSLDVEVDGAAQTSSGVVDIGYPILSDSGFGEGRKFLGVLHGNAITIDLGRRGLVFVVDLLSLAPAAKPGARNTLRPPGSVRLSDLPLIAYGFPSEGLPSEMAKVVRQLQQKTGSVDVPIDKLPMFVRFKDINDPGSIEEIEPADLEATFGPGVKLVRARVELTRDPITPMPSTWPKWLVEAKNLGFPMRSSLAKGLSINLWVRGFKNE